MSDTLTPVQILLIDSWPDPGGPSADIPKDGFTGVDHHNVVAAKYKPGTKAVVYNKTTGNVGWGTMIYLRCVGAHAAELADVCSISDEGTEYTNIEALSAGFLNTAGSGQACVAISAITDDYYGWYWCGGNCPFDHLGSGATTLTVATTIETDGSVAAGDEITAYNASNTGKFKRVIDTTGTLALAVCGFAMATDVA